MPYIRYTNWKPGSQAMGVIAETERICTEYQAQGYDLTLRQLYYQFVARGLIANTQAEYSKLGTIVNKGRLAGFIDWDYIVDRTRNLRSLAHWDSPNDIVSAAARSFRFDAWATQPTRVEVWVEKEALAGVVQRAAEAYDVPWFSCRGYVSQSELWGAAQRLLPYIEQGQNVVVLHLGDHDPSGIDMTRDILERLLLFTTQDYLDAHPDDFPEDRVTRQRIRDVMSLRCEAEPLVVRRIALNMDQVEQYNPPPNPAKLTDSRARTYIERFGSESWELDALDPATLANLITQEIEDVLDVELWNEHVQRQESERRVLSVAAQRWHEVADFVGVGES